MRRTEFSITEPEETESFLQEMSFGVLGTIGEDGWPQLTPLNFAYQNGELYFHGSRVGSKMEHLKRDPRVTFSVAKEYAIIPSTFSDPKLACPATSYFKSVLIKGYAEPIADLDLKASALTAFMRKLQPEGGYAPIDPLDPDYTPQIKATAVVRIRITELSAKFKFGQNVKEPRFSKITEGLEQRNRPLDVETIELMRAYCPHHKEQP
ncbi:pyridoxamine 5'-phosphate oxidase family protein [Paenibacillus radicis (ex Xue et al. 2023)]|uniref:Pyridoxamine 5'-phosphate oxidase family protein n=1 Tax=Paenibacillus radicis (ex Xue et al. 2023) TaxID=2972489 RepID=A0ABT1Y967_9BACL|nr:pyridoxamine 5'-phosphate oxidase family protein [Paenibacillus radicis (ex Xue et al. 2023)]MCR8629740.1 pyridoxamine 5'-phosphate oxidase family protein [Paenibacillus radicis (ex Xue et al. 2023)]